MVNRQSVPCTSCSCTFILCDANSENCRGLGIEWLLVFTNIVDLGKLSVHTYVYYIIKTYKYFGSG